MDLWESWGCPCSAPMYFYCSAFIYLPFNLCSGRRKEQSGPRSGNQLMKKWRKQQVSISVAIHFSSNSALPVPVGELCACTLHMACTSQFPSTSQSSSDAELCPSPKMSLWALVSQAATKKIFVCIGKDGSPDFKNFEKPISSLSVILYFRSLKTFWGSR